MTNERAYIAFRLNEPVRLKTIGSVYPRIKQVIIQRKENRSLLDKIEHHNEVLVSFVLLDPNLHSTVQCRAEDLDETVPPPDKEMCNFLLKGFVRA